MRLSSGVRLHVMQQGPQHGPAFVMLHGFPDSGFSFSGVLPLLPPDLRIVVPDLRGFGESDKPATGYSMTDLAMDVLTLMDDLHLPSATIVGHSMGSFVARRTAELGRDRVDTLVLIGSAATPRNDVVRSLARQVERFTDPIDPAFVREFQLSTTFRTLAGTVPGATDRGEPQGTGSRLEGGTLGVAGRRTIGGAASLPNLRDWWRGRCDIHPARTRSTRRADSTRLGHDSRRPWAQPSLGGSGTLR